MLDKDDQFKMDEWTDFCRPPNEPTAMDCNGQAIFQQVYFGQVAEKFPDKSYYTNNSQHA